MCATDTIEHYDDYTIDSEGGHSREWDNFGTMVTSHKRYLLGDVQKSDGIEALEWAISECGRTFPGSYNERCWESDFEQLAYLEDVLEEVAVVLPLYLYDHSGLMMNTTGFSCSWDSGQVGYIFVSKDDVRQEFGQQFDPGDSRFKRIAHVLNI